MNGRKYKLENAGKENYCLLKKEKKTSNFVLSREKNLSLKHFSQFNYLIYIINYNALDS